MDVDRASGRELWTWIMDDDHGIDGSHYPGLHVANVQASHHQTASISLSLTMHINLIFISSFCLDFPGSNLVLDLLSTKSCQCDHSNSSKAGNSSRRDCRRDSRNATRTARHQRQEGRHCRGCKADTYSNLFMELQGRGPSLPRRKSCNSDLSAR